MDSGTVRTLSYQAYFLGCSFDTWSNDMWDRLYVVTLVVLGYFVPLSVIMASYGAIYAITRRTRRDLVAAMV